MGTGTFQALPSSSNAIWITLEIVEGANNHIEQHYFRKNLFEEICNRLKDQNIDLGSVKRSDISGVDEFHVMGARVSKELASQLQLDGHTVLDVGCGLGGPCRMLADEFDCKVTGVDLSSEFIRTAKKLSELVGLANKTSFIVGNATKLPFENQSFDMVWTQHVQMNVEDKKTFYTEIFRVLKPGGHFLYYDIFKDQENKKIEYPMPWATEPSMSFLFKSDEMNAILNALGCNQLSKKNLTQEGISFFENVLADIKKMGPPKLGLNVLMGESTQVKLSNLLHHLKNGALMLESGMYIKKA